MMSSPDQSSSLPGPASFLFTVRELDANGYSEQDYDNSHWYPPTKASKIDASPAKTVYRWKDGSISKENRYLSRISRLISYKANSVFWCDKRIQFVTAEGDASLDDVSAKEAPFHRWRELQFHPDDYDKGLSRLTYSGEPSLCGTGPCKWIEHLGLDSYDDSDDATPASGLGGELPMVIAILAFSCKPGKLEKVLLTDKAWRKGEWKCHKESSGRIKERGIVVNTYYDPDNAGSTKEALSFVEFGYGSILVW